MSDAMVSTRERRYPIIEVFGPTIQGEGIQTGHVTHFLRFGGCGYKCTWCDSMHAVDPKQIKENRTMMTVGEIGSAILRLPQAPWITFTGGDPCMHDLTELVTWCDRNRISTCVETQGEFWPKWLYDVDVITLSPKPPSSGNVTAIETFVQELVMLRQRANGQICIKPVIFDSADLQYAITLYEHLEELPVATPYHAYHFQVGSPLTSEVPPPTEDINEKEYYHACEEWKRRNIFARYQWLVESLMSLSHKFNNKVAVTPQLHTLLWPLEDTGR